MLEKDLIIEIDSAEYVHKYQIKLNFSDGTTRIVNFEPFLKRTSNPLIQKYLNLELFKDFSIVYGDLVWNDYDLCFPIADLYEGHI